MIDLFLRDRWQARWTGIKSCYRVVTITEAPFGEFRRGPKQRLEIQLIPADNHQLVTCSEQSPVDEET